MKKVLFLLLAFTVSVGAWAQDTKKTPEQRAQKITEKMEKKLLLTNDQKTKVYDLTLQKVNELQALRQGGGDGQTKQAERQKIRTAYMDGMKGILTADQYSKFAKAMDKKAQGKGKNKGKGKDKGKGKGKDKDKDNNSGGKTDDSDDDGDDLDMD